MSSDENPLVIGKLTRSSRCLFQTRPTPFSNVCPSDCTAKSSGTEDKNIRTSTLVKLTVCLLSSSLWLFIYWVRFRYARMFALLYLHGETIRSTSLGFGNFVGIRECNCSPSPVLMFFLPRNNVNLSRGCCCLSLFEFDEAVWFLWEREPFFHWAQKISPIYNLTSILQWDYLQILSLGSGENKLGLLSWKLGE